MKHLKPISRAQSTAITGVMILQMATAIIAAVTPFIAVVDSRKKGTEA